MPPCVPLDQAVVFVRAVTVVVGAEGREDSESCIATQAGMTVMIQSVSVAGWIRNFVYKCTLPQ